jgi:dTDP-4-amino-4,6-dideoxygalactose transaminase
MKLSENYISWWRTSFSNEDIEKVSESIRNENISMGSVTEEFEQRLAKALNVPYVVATTSGSIALMMALMAMGIETGDEVIVPNRTWIATAHAPMLLGAKPVLVDVLPDRPVMDTSIIGEKITSKTKAIIPAQLNGRAVEMEQVWEIAKKYGLLVVEDSAQGLFSKYKDKYMGTESDAGCFSFSVAKLIPTGQGGVVITRRRDIYKKMKLIRTQGVDDVNSGTPFLRMGFNFRYTDLQASIGLVQLNKVDQRIKNLKVVYKKYQESLKEINYLQLIPVYMEKDEIPLYVEAIVEEREKLMEHLASHNIQIRPMYPDLDTANHLKCSDNFPNSRVFGKQGLVLPCGPDQPLENIDKVIEVLCSIGRRI